MTGEVQSKPLNHWGSGRTRTSLRPRFRELRLMSTSSKWTKLLPYGFFAIWLLQSWLYYIESGLRQKGRLTCIRSAHGFRDISQPMLTFEYGKMPAHRFLIGRNQPAVRPSQVKHPGQTVQFAGTCSRSDCISSPNISSFVGHGLTSGVVAPCCR